MRKVFSIALLLALSVAVLAQKDVTKFLGIPVDGTKLEMKQKLINKGFTYNSRDDVFEGEFNGSDVTVAIVTNNNKVWRILVTDATPSREGDIRIRFNNLCRQFSKNGKYLPMNADGYYISEDEDISYEISVNNKRYQASYAQVDSAATRKQLKEKLLKKYTQEQLDNPTEQEQTEIELLKLEEAFIAFDAIQNKQVWFMIQEYYGKYYIAMFYDNGFNKADGEDL